MLTLAVLLNIAVSAGLFAMAYRYMSAKALLSYHVEIMGNAGASNETKMILMALYRAMGGAFAAIGAGCLLLTVFGIWGDVFWPKLTVLVMALISGVTAILGAKPVEDATSVKTPWRIAAVLMAVAIVAFVLSLF